MREVRHLRRGMEARGMDAQGRGTGVHDRGASGRGMVRRDGQKKAAGQEGVSGSGKDDLKDKRSDAADSANNGESKG